MARRGRIGPGGVVLAANPIAFADPVVLTDFLLYDARRAPRFLARSSLFQGNGLVDRVMRGAGQIPVQRHPDLWPLQARTGVARLALRSGAPVVPVAQWGAQRISLRLQRTRVRFRVGPPADLSSWAGREPTAQVLRARSA